MRGQDSISNQYDQNLLIKRAVFALLLYPNSHYPPSFLTVLSVYLFGPRTWSPGKRHYFPEARLHGPCGNISKNYTMEISNLQAFHIFDFQIRLLLSRILSPFQSLPLFLPLSFSTTSPVSPSLNIFLHPCILHFNSGARGRPWSWKRSQCLRCGILHA